MMRFQLNKIFKNLATFILLVIIIGIAASTRLSTMASPTVLDYDPWWHYRRAAGILENNFKIPQWDLLSFFPPGRPIAKFQGWAYTMAVFFKLISFFEAVTFMEVAKWAPVIMVGLTVIPAFLLGRLLTNKWAGFVTALFATLTPTFMGVSMAGYCDTDVVVVFYSFSCVYTIFLAIRKKSIPYYLLSVLSNLVFIYNWGAGWLILLMFTIFFPMLVIFRIIEEFIHKRRLRLDLSPIMKEIKNLLFPLLIILVITNIISYFLGLGDMFRSFLGGFRFTSDPAGRQIVNVSVAELQPLSIFTRSGFLAVAGRVGLVPMLFTLFGLPLLVLYKIYKKQKIHYTEIFLFLWIIVLFYLISRGVRFSLLFSTAIAASAGYVIGNLIHFLKKNVIGAIVLGFTGLLLLMYVSDAIQQGYAGRGMQISRNWYEMLDWLNENADEKALVTTWWDPGHIIAGYTGLRVHADGAHCAPGVCIPNPHNVRIQDMGKIMSTSSEEEAVETLEKYRQLTPEECQQVKEKFGDKVPEEACEPASEIYFIASNDLIGKFTWMNYFGGYRAPIKSNTDFMRNPGVCCASTPKTEPGQISCGEWADQGRGVWVWCPWIFSLKETKQDQEGNPVYIYNYAGLTIALVQKDDQIIPIYNNQFLINHLSFFYQGERQDVDLSSLNTTLDKIDGLIWLQPDFRSLIYLAPAIKDSIFVRTFFYDGVGLEHFEQVFTNSEIRLYKLV